MSHLGRWLSALVDDELDGAERDRVLNHLARCVPCRQEANALRALKRRMTALGDSSADSTIAGRLIELARSDFEVVGGEARHPAGWPPPSVSLAAWGRHQVRSGWMLAAGSAGLALSAIGAVAFMLGGGQPTPAPRITPAVEIYWVQHGYDTGQVPAARLGPTSASGGPGSGAGPTAGPDSAGQPTAQPSAATPSAAPEFASTPSARPRSTASPTASPTARPSGRRHAP